MVAAIRTDHQIAIAFHDAVPRATFNVLHLLHQLRARRSLLNPDRTCRNGSGVLAPQRNSAGGQARGE